MRVIPGPVVPAPSVLVLGNSFTQGTQVADDEVFTALLQARLGQPVLNMGHDTRSLADNVVAAPVYATLLAPRWTIVQLIPRDLILRRPPRNQSRFVLPVMVCWLMTFFVVTVAWVPFRAGTFDATGAILRSLSGRGNGLDVWYPTDLAWAVFLVATGYLCGVLMERRPSVFRALDADVAEDAMSGRYLVLHLRSFRGAVVATAGVLAVIIFAGGISPFIYFQF